MKIGDMAILAENVALDAVDKLRRDYPEYRFSASGTHNGFRIFVEQISPNEEVVKEGVQDID